MLWLGVSCSQPMQFRGWIDDLLKTSWEACQGTDVLVESPSAMAGYHIAEALKIPYFRAFTMTWSRTRSVHLTCCDHVCSQLFIEHTRMRLPFLSIRYGVRTAR